MPVSRIRQIFSKTEGYVHAVAFVATAFVVVWMLGGILPFTFFLAAVMLAAWFCGAPVGFFALALSFACL